jgi:hypothetical protein
VAGLQFGLGFAKTIFWGKGFGKTETNVFEIQRGFGFGFRPQKGVWGMNAGGILFWIFSARTFTKRGDYVNLH